MAGKIKPVPVGKSNHGYPRALGLADIHRGDTGRGVMGRLEVACRDAVIAINIQGTSELERAFKRRIKE